MFTFNTGCLPTVQSWSYIYKSFLNGLIVILSHITQELHIQWWYLIGISYVIDIIYIYHRPSKMI